MATRSTTIFGTAFVSQDIKNPVISGERLFGRPDPDMSFCEHWSLNFSDARGKLTIEVLNRIVGANPQVVRREVQISLRYRSSDIQDGMRE